MKTIGQDPVVASRSMPNAGRQARKIHAGATVWDRTREATRSIPPTKLAWRSTDRSGRIVFRDSDIFIFETRPKWACLDKREFGDLEKGSKGFCNVGGESFC